MPHRTTSPLRTAQRWSLGILIVFFTIGVSFGTWLSRLPAVRDHLGASTLEMSIYGLCLASGCLIGLITSGRAVTALGPRRTLVIGGLVQAVAMPAAISIIWTGAIPVGLGVLFVYGYAFASCDVAMNVSGANAERALGKVRMSLYHGAYSLGGVSALGLGALAERLAIPAPWHFLGIYILILIGLLSATRALPTRDGEAMIAEARSEAAEARQAVTGSIPIIRSGEDQLPAFTTMTGSLPIITPSDHPRPTPGHSERYSPWRDSRVLLVGLVALCASLAEGTASDWLPLALVDGRSMPNDTAAIMLAVFFVSMMAGRVSGSAVITRFGRVTILRASFALCAAGVASLLLVPSMIGIVLGTAAWGLGSALGFPVAISAAADDPKTAVRSVAAVSAIAYTALLVGPMAFGFLGEFIGLLTSFWVIVAMALIGGALSFATREPGSAPRRGSGSRS